MSTKIDVAANRLHTLFVGGQAVVYWERWYKLQLPVQTAILKGFNRCFKEQGSAKWSELPHEESSVLTCDGSFSNDSEKCCEPLLIAFL